MRQRQKRRRVASIGVLVLVVGTSYWWSQELSHVLATRLIKWNSHFRVNHVIVTGTEILAEAAVLDLAKVPARHCMFTLSFADIAKRIKKNPWVKAVNVRRRLPDTVELEITERIPVAAVRGERMMVITADSMAITPPAENWVWDLPILSPPKSARFESGARIKDNAVLALLHQTAMARSVSPDIWKNISELYYSQDQIHAVLNAPQADIIAGRGVSELSWIGLQSFLEENSRDSTESHITVDLRIPGRLVVSQDDTENAEHRVG